MQCCHAMCMVLILCYFSLVVGNVVLGHYRYTNDLLMLEATVPHEVLLPGVCGYVSTPLNHAMWSLLLSEHPDRQFVGYVIRGLRSGFRVGCCSSAPELRSATSNMFSAVLHPDVINKYLREELEANRLVEVPCAGVDMIHISRFGAIPKKHQPGKWRLIVDLSSPQDQSVNDGIDPALCSLSYASVEDAAAFVLRAGRGALLAKLDIKVSIPEHSSSSWRQTSTRHAMAK